MKDPVIRAAALILAASLLPSCKDDVAEGLGGPGGTVIVRDPAAPSNLTAVAQSNGVDIILTWQDNSNNEVEFRIDVDDEPFGTPVVIESVLVSANTTTHTYQTIPGTTLYFRVLSHTALHESDPSNVVSATTPNVPSAPLVLTATAVSSSQVDLQWFPNSLGGTPTSYRIERSDGGGPWGTLTTIPAAGSPTTHSDTGLSSTTQYCYRVYGINVDGEGAPSAQACATTTLNLTITTVTPGGSYISMAVSPTGVEHISHWPSASNGILYTTNSLGSYQTIDADNGPGAFQTVGANGTSIDVDSIGRAHVTGMHTNLEDLRYASGTIAGFSPVTLLAGPSSDGWFPNLEISPVSGNINIIFNRRVTAPSFSETLNTIFFNGTSWVGPTPIFTGVQIRSNDMAIHTDDTIHVAFLNYDFNTNTSTLYHAAKSVSSPWQVAPVPVAVGVDTMPSITVDGSGFPHIVFNRIDAGQAWGDLYHVTNSSGSWVEESVHVDRSTEIGRHNSVDYHFVSGILHVSFLDSLNDVLYYAGKNLSGGGWVVSQVDTGIDANADTAIVVDPGAVVHIAYRDGLGNLTTAVGTP